MKIFVSEMMCCLVSIACMFCMDIDEREGSRTNLGRVDYHNMCDQQRMEKLVEELGVISMFMNNVDDGDYKDVCDWPGVTCSEDGSSVLKINWYNKTLKGTMDLTWIPPTVTYFNVSVNDITGTLVTAALPCNMKTFHLGSNKYSGTIDWKGLPPSIEHLYLSCNQFEGNVALDDLPCGVKYLSLSNKQVHFGN